MFGVSCCLVFLLFPDLTLLSEITEFSVDCSKCGEWKKAGSCYYQMGIEGQYMWRDVYQDDRQGCSKDHCLEFGCDVTGDCKGENVDIDNECQENCMKRFSSWKWEPYRGKCEQTIHYRQCTGGKCSISSNEIPDFSPDVMSRFSCSGCSNWIILGGCVAGDGTTGILRYRRSLQDNEDCFKEGCGITACDSTYNHETRSDCDGSVMEGKCEKCLQRLRIWFKENGVCHDRVEYRRCEECDEFTFSKRDSASQNEGDPASQNEGDPASQNEVDTTSQNEGDPASQNERDIGSSADGSSEKGNPVTVSDERSQKKAHHLPLPNNGSTEEAEQINMFY